MHTLKIGLEIHTQLKTARKLFSLSHNNTSNLLTKPNSQVSFFDVSLPGSQPRLNPQAIVCALKCAIGMNCRVNAVSKFDRKHYFYGDQPLGYQITQRYHAIANDGKVLLTKRYDGLAEDRSIGIEQIQLEQDTGRSLYKLDNGTTDIDFNRSNIPLVEMVTRPDFNDIEQVRAFIKKYTKMLQNYDICTGELETGAIRVDVNVNIDQFQRIELKNIPTTSAIVNAIRYEYKRQCQVVDNGGSIDEVETRGWDGKKTYRLRSKEDSIDYRYMPDPELPAIKLDLEDVMPKLKQSLPMSVEDKMERLIKQYGLKLRDVNILMNDPELLEYYLDLYEEVVTKKGLSNPINWLVHDFLGCLTKSEKEFSRDLFPIREFSGFLELIEDGTLTKQNGKLLMMHLMNNKKDQAVPIRELVESFGMKSVGGDGEELREICRKVIRENEAIVRDIVEKKKRGKMNYLVGMCMRESGGRVDAGAVKKELASELEKWRPLE
ncbi:DEKNAAC103275 [Brettanomyces naardenensis]|uniref:Glutamyl-tRNA(Gln) amidotransferase subunit B, mitochondrial n=1 Tax=Brettanomyces naardenensis TaxID=13370 RepID=A0A448YMZ0_BRENA|nr:DEKNAAC103275 [Brettanomyces naardenensis]